MNSLVFPAPYIRVSTPPCVYSLHGYVASVYLHECFSVFLLRVAGGVM